ncbi:hypothetical protein TWF696_007885 [Orbilia brochopaga]|uniref:Mso1 N-terminal domain-containing protein n=1 Tax=Orbilia brochopaga TaxID=3140254 RepID=A0AAV9ULG5_9PEZI
MASFLSSLTKAAKSKVANISLPSFIDNSDADHGENEDESAVSRALRDYYKERDGFVPEWLSTITTSFMATATPPPPKPSEGAPAASGMLGDIFSGEAPRQGTTPPPQQMRRPSTKPQSVSPVYPQQYPPPPGPPAQPQMQSQPQLQPPQQQPQQPQRSPVGLPSGPRGGVKPFMTLKREQQQRQQSQTAPPQTFQQPPPPPGPPRDHHSYGGGSSHPPPSNNVRQQHPPPPSHAQSYSGSSGRSRFADAAGEPRRPSITPTASVPSSRSTTQSSSEKPFMSATAPWANSADSEFGGGWGASPGFYGR